MLTAALFFELANEELAIDPFILAGIADSLCPFSFDLDLFASESQCQEDIAVSRIRNLDNPFLCFFRLVYFYRMRLFLDFE
jgi:hypothetical protein